ncbi:hypothetical protein [Albibacterium profundi]|uniref:Uncharacterized protein n=1 Tax=Albibacterium profundi TaxID=3134906 RepID=A0ABV5C9M8_9SPHI
MKDITRLHLIEMELDMAGELTLENLLAYHQAAYFYKLFDEHFNRHEDICTCSYWRAEQGVEELVN